MGRLDIPDDACTDCEHCKPCPNGVDIAANMRLWRMMRREGVTTQLRDDYAHLRATTFEAGPNGTHAGACRDCGECEARCPEHVRVIRRLQDLAAALER